MSLAEIEMEGLGVVKCKYCKAFLLEDFSKTNDCQHFEWVRVSVPCFLEYFRHPECDADTIFNLRRKYLLRVKDGENYCLLVPRRGDGR